MTAKMPERITVEFGAERGGEPGSRSYDIVVGPGLIADAGTHLTAILNRPHAVIVTDDMVAGLHLPAFRASLEAAGIAHDAVVLPAGEASKSYAILEHLLDRLLDARVERDDMIVALGGGVIGDLTGFAASVLRRGVDFIQVPTTLLAQVDSSVGGKTGINCRHGKNLIGSFHQPRLVLADTGTLVTLPNRDLRAGYAEVVKYGLINDAAFFGWLEENGDAVLALDEAAVAHAVTTSCRAKAAIVVADEREGGVRALLNLGHTFGHAFEAEAGYGRRLLHGEAVALGMVIAFDLSVRLGHCPADDARRVRAHLSAHGLPVHATEIGASEIGASETQVPTFDVDRLIGHMAQDKKVKAGRITFVLTSGIGKAFLSRDVDEHDVRAVLKTFVQTG